MRLRFSFSASHASTAGETLTVHEWAAFTSFEDESGKEISGINHEDVAIPDSLHRIAPGPILPVKRGGETGAAETCCHSQVTMRLEKAAINFYPTDCPLPISVEVEARSYRGWLTQYTPGAKVKSPGFTRDSIGAIGFDLSSLQWDLDVIGPAINSMEAGEDPRPARIESNGERADSLIFRGVSADRALLRVVRDGPGMVITSASDAHLDISEVWLVETRKDGRLFLQALRPFNEGTAFVIKTSASFAASEAAGDLEDLKTKLQEALRRAGLFPDEADGLVATVAAAHFRRPGLRVFFIAPAKPWNSSARASIQVRHAATRSMDLKTTRVVLDCIEIVTPEQRATLASIAAGGETRSVTGQRRDPESLSENEWQNLKRLYESLGQFGNALLLDEQRRRPSAILDAFIKRFRLQGYTPPNEWLPERARSR